MIPWNPTHRKLFDNTPVMAQEVGRPGGSSLYFYVSLDGVGGAHEESDFHKLYAPLPSAPAEMPDELSVNDRLIAECDSDNEWINIHPLSLDVEESAALLAWLPRVLAWQRGAP